MVTAIFVIIAIIVVWQVILPAGRVSSKDKLQRKKFTPAAISAKEALPASDDLATSLLEPDAKELKQAELLRSVELQLEQGRSESEVRENLREQQWDEATIEAILAAHKRNKP